MNATPVPSGLNRPPRRIVQLSITLNAVDRGARFRITRRVSFSPSLTWPRDAPIQTPPYEAHLPALTRKQSDILESVARGYANKDIARQFGITEVGVKKHLQRVFAKLGAANRSEAVAIALKKQLLKI